MCRSGRTSYCVTTGPVFVATTVAGMPKLLSLSSMIRMLSSWFARVVVTGGSGTIVSRSIGGRTQSGPRAGSRPRPRAGRPRRPRCRAAAPRRHAHPRRRAARPTRPSGSSGPRWAPGPVSGAARCPRRDRAIVGRPTPRSAAALFALAARAAAASGASATTVPRLVRPRRNGATNSARRRLAVMRMPPTNTAARTTNAPGRVMSEPSTSARNVPIRPPPRTGRNSNRPRGGVGRPSRPRAASASPGRAGRHSMRPPAVSRKIGSSQRPVPKLGRTTLRAQSVRVPCGSGSPA